MISEIVWARALSTFGWKHGPRLVLCACALGCSSDDTPNALTAQQIAGMSATPAPSAGAGERSLGAVSGSGGRPAAGSGGANTGGNVAAPVGGDGGQPAAGNSAPLAAGSSAGTAGTSVGAPPAGSGGGGVAGTAADGPAGMAPIDAPVADDCITDVSPGDHSFTCQGLKFLVMVAEPCTKHACGLIFDVHGAAMSAEIMRNNNQLHELAPPKGYLVVHPNANGSTWNLETDPPILADFVSRMIAAFHVDPKRVHMTGFSMGSAMTFWFLCNHPELLASTGPVTGVSADQATVMGTGASCIESIDADWQPRVPILFMSGRMDGALTITAAQARTDGIVSRLGLTGGDQIDGDATYARRRWQGVDGMVFDFLEHDYSNALLMGHCIPGGSANDPLFACTSGGDSLHWGKTVLQWFVDHPKP